MRTREFDRSEALLNSMELFWWKGYFDTSIEDLTKVTRVSRSGLYGEFENKRSLFLEAISHYERLVTDQIMGTLERSAEGLGGIEKTFKMVLKAAEEKRRWGCLVCNTSSEVSDSDPEIKHRVALFHKRVRGAFRGALLRAKAKKEISKRADVERISDYLLGSFQGLAHAIRSPMSQKALESYVGVTLAGLRKS